ncbi:MAG TPA: hypothetical protein VGO86_08285, partial [Candidatus Dormibacteraeota bacterium]
LELGQDVGWKVAGPRRCIGLYDRREHRRRRCPVGALVADGSQCDLCERADPGRLVARGQAPSGMEQEPFVLYLAWFGDGLSKVGITSEKRGMGRLCEQAALSYCLAARGPFTSIRQAEVLLSSIGVAPERLASRTKQAAWWRIPPAEERATELAALHKIAADAIRALPRTELLEFQASDLTPLFGLEREMPDRYELVTAVRPGAVLGGQITHVIGRSVVLSPTQLVVDTGLLEGWTLRRSAESAGGLDVETRTREADARAVQGTLF